MQPLASSTRQLKSLWIAPRRAHYPYLAAILITCICLVSLWPFSGAEDIANARQNILDGERTDFWGGFSQFFYVQLGTDAPLWHILLGIIHVALVLIGTLLAIAIIRKNNQSNSSLWFLLIIHYLATVYCLHLSRDATLLAFLWLGIPLILWGTTLKRNSYYWMAGGLLLIIFGLSFRPWLSIAFVPLIFAIAHHFKYSKKSLQGILLTSLTVFTLSIGPLALDLTTKSAMNLKSSYPEQQVMILDIASIACLSPDKVSQSIAIEALTPLSNTSGLNRERLCGQFYPQSWASVTFYSNPSDPALKMIEVNDIQTYRTIRASWLDLISSHPTQYLQMKLMQLSQLFLAGDSIRIKPSSVLQIPTVPYELLKATRLLSFLPVCLLLAWLTFSSRFKIIDGFRRAIFMSYVVSIGIVTIAFIGDNQRYISWIGLILLLAYLISPRTEKHSTK